MNNDHLVQKFFHEYHDRGMMKWEGFYLSDHTSALTKKEKEKRARFSRERGQQMDEADIQKVINYAIEKNKRITVELLEIDKSMVFSNSISGEIEGHFGSKLVIDGKFVDFSNIYSIY